MVRGRVRVTVTVGVRLGVGLGLGVGLELCWRNAPVENALLYISFCAAHTAPYVRDNV